MVGCHARIGMFPGARKANSWGGTNSASLAGCIACPFHLLRPTRSVPIQSSEATRPIFPVWSLRGFWRRLQFGQACATL